MSNPKPSTSKFGLPACPYCGKRLNPFVAWSYKSKGEFYCKKCGKYSNIGFSGMTVGLALCAIGVSVVLLLLFLFLFGMSPWAVLYIAIPFLVFFLCTPFLVRLLPIQASPSRRGAPPSSRRSSPSQQAPPPSRTARPPARPPASQPSRRPPASRIESARSAPPSSAGRRQNPPSSQPRLFDTMEFGKRPPRDSRQDRE